MLPTFNPISLDNLSFSFSSYLVKLTIFLIFKSFGLIYFILDLIFIRFLHQETFSQIHKVFSVTTSLRCFKTFLETMKEFLKKLTIPHLLFLFDTITHLFSRVLIFVQNSFKQVNDKTNISFIRENSEKRCFKIKKGNLIFQVII